MSKTNTGKTSPALGWIRDLYEVGTLRDLARTEEEMLAQRAALLRQIEAIDVDVVALRKRAVREVAECYTPAEVEQAKRYAATVAA